MIDHLGFNVADVARSRAFYDRALAPLNIGVVMAVDLPQMDGILSSSSPPNSRCEKQ